MPMKLEYAGINTLLQPPFEGKVIREDETYIWRVDRFGCTLREFKHQMTMPEWIDFPVKTATDLERILTERFDSSALHDRLPGDLEKKLALWQNGNFDKVLYLDGGCYYGTLRNMAGVENASLLLYDSPQLCEELFERINYYCMEGLKRVLPKLKVNYLGFGEDIAYRFGPLVSPEMIRGMIVPHYKKVTEYARRFGVDITWYDSDGDLRLILDDLLGAGINCFAPLEIAADMDPVRLREKYGRKIRLIGGIDKRKVAEGRDAIRQVFRDTVRPLLDQGGYLPAIDHSVSADISWDNYRIFVDELVAAAENV